MSVHTRCALVGAALGVGMCQDVLTADLVVQGVEATAGFCLRLRPNLVYWRKPGRCRLGAGQKGECQYGHRSAVTAS